MTSHLSISGVESRVFAYCVIAIDEEEWGSDEEEIMEQYASSQMNTDSDGSNKLTRAHIAINQSHVFHLCRQILQGLVSVPDFNNVIGMFPRSLLPRSDTFYAAGDFVTMRIRVCNALNNLIQIPQCEGTSIDGGRLAIDLKGCL